MMKKKRNGQTEPLLEALRPLDQINSLPPSPSPPPFPPPKSVVGFGCKRHSLQNGVA